MRVILFAAVGVALLQTGVAQAQRSPGAPPAAPGPSTVPPMRGPESILPDERMTYWDKLQNQVKAGPTKSLDPVPAAPEDVTVGSQVRDSKGLVLGSVERVGDGFAVIATPAGRVEVEFASIAKNRKGLLINMRKSKFDAIVAGTASASN